MDENGLLGAIEQVERSSATALDQTTYKWQQQWVDFHQADAAEVLIAELPYEEDTYALIDNGFDTTFAKALKQRFPGVTAISLYAGLYEGPELDEMAPSLVLLPLDAVRRKSLIDFMLKKTSGMPMLSFISQLSSQQHVNVQDHLQRQLDASDEDGNGFLIRYADTRALAAILTVLTQKQRQRLLAGMRWWYFDRTGQLLSCAEEWASILSDTEPYRFDAEQTKRLREKSVPDAVMMFIRRSPHIFGNLNCKPSQAFFCIEEVITSLAAVNPTHDAELYRKVLDALSNKDFLSDADWHPLEVDRPDLAQQSEDS